MGKKYEVWTEGFQVTGQSSNATFHGLTEAESFEAACIKLIGIDVLDSDHKSIWGCRCFNNEVDARKTFG